MMILDDNHSILYQDACQNFETARYHDAFKGFEYLMNATTDQDKIGNFLYFAYRAFTSGEVIDEPLPSIILLRKIGQKSLTFCAKLIVSRLDGIKNLQIRVKMLEELQQVLSLIGEEEKRYEVISNMIPLYRQLAEEHDNTDNEKYSYLERIVVLLEEVEDIDGSNDVLLELATAYSTNAESMIRGGWDKYQIEYTFQKAIEIFEKLGQPDKIERIRGIIRNLPA